MRLYIMLMFTVIMGLCSIWAGGLEAVPPDPTPTPAPAQVSVGQSFTLALQKQAVLKNGQGEVVFEAILEDSRCPANAECFTAGAVSVQVSVDGQAYTLTLGDLMPGESSVVRLANGLRLELLEVSPYPASQEDTPDAVPTVQLMISG